MARDPKITPITRHEPRTFYATRMTRTQAGEAWEVGDWDVILMDVHMPVMDGPTATRLIRKREAETGRLRTPIVALTANAMAHQVETYAADGMDDFALLTIPFFVLAGAIMSEGGVARRLVNLAKVFVGFIRGGLALVNVLASTLFGCLSGSFVADTASIGSVMIPEMVRNGYSKVFATNVTICGSVQAILVPPSHNSIIYSIATGGTVSIPALFMAGVFPGLLFGLSVIALVLVITGIAIAERGRL